MPSIEKRFDLRLARLAFGRLEKKIVVALRVEGRVQVDEVHRLVGDLAAEHVEVVPVVERVHPRIVAQRPDRIAETTKGRVSGRPETRSRAETRATREISPESPRID